MVNNMEWQKAEIAPRSKLCLVWQKDALIPAIASLHIGDEKDGIYFGRPIWIGIDDDEYYDDVTHWMPLPEAPK